MGRNYKEFYGLLKKMAVGIDSKELKETLVLGFSGNRTKSLKELQSHEYSQMIGAMYAQLAENKDAPADMWRKRAMGAVGAWLRMSKKVDNQDLIIGIICRSAGKKLDDKVDNNTFFNRITVSNLRAIYAEFRNKYRAGYNSNEMEDVTNE